MSTGRNIGTVVFSIFIILLFVAARLFGTQFFDNNWSFGYWQHQPWWYNILWVLLFSTAVYFALTKSQQIATILNSRLRVIAAALLLLVMLIVLHFDSILYAGANLRVAQIAQTDYIIHRWFEYASSLFVSTVYSILKVIGMSANDAGVYSWVSLLLTSTILSLIGSIMLIGELTRRKELKLWLFLLIFFGPQTLVYFGLLGPESLLVAFTIWFVLIAVKAYRQRTITAIAAVWSLTIMAFLFHYTALFLIPAAVYVTIKCVRHSKKWALPVIIPTSLSLVVVIATLYFLGSNNLEFSQKLLFIKGKNPFANYGLLSIRHISDVLQILLLTFPQILIALYLSLKDTRQGSNPFLFSISWLLLLSGFSVLFVLSPVNSVVMDFPRFVVYLTPAGILIASFLKTSESLRTSSVKLPALLAVMALFLPLSYLPVHSRINTAEPYLTEYLDQHTPYYVDAGIAFRDAYFYNREFEKAGDWENKLGVKCPDYLGYTGANNLIARDQLDPALDELYLLKTKYPYWPEPRVVIFNVQLRLAQYDVAKAEIDTLLMLQPYKMQHHHSLFNYYRSTSDFSEALSVINNSLNLFPEDKTLLVDKMTALYSTRQILLTDSLAVELIRRDSTLEYPYLYRGLIMEHSANKQGAIRNFEKFIKLAPEAPETPEIRKRLNTLALEEK